MWRKVGQNSFAMSRAIASTNSMPQNIGTWYSNLDSLREGSRACDPSKNRTRPDLDCKQRVPDRGSVPAPNLATAPPKRSIQE
jgi:hypothetical protein